jgi:periplasmic protein TonB
MKPTCARTLALGPSLVGPFPLIGESHPVKQRYNHFLYAAAGFALLLHLTAFLGWSLARMGGPGLPDLPGTIRTVTVLPPPPPTDPNAAEPVGPVVEASVGMEGIPDPVVDFKAEAATIMSQSEMEAAYPRESLDLQMPGPGDSIILRMPEDAVAGTPGPFDYVACEEKPVLISIPAPVYPEMARMAEREGVVIMRVLVGKDGRVKDAIVTNGVILLDEAALQAARGAVFRPALQRHHPVEVWVEVPMRFTLN